jgi:xylulokinase
MQREGRAVYLGLDLGTSGLKGILIGEDQALLAQATVSLSLLRPVLGHRPVPQQPC